LFTYLLIFVYDMDRDSLTSAKRVTGGTIVYRNYLSKIKYNETKLEHNLKHINLRPKETL